MYIVSFLLFAGGFASWIWVSSGISGCGKGSVSLIHMADFSVESNKSCTLDDEGRKIVWF